jgi:quinol-cytochrome oxidoreductase complex cytochrome b subunit
VVRAYLVSVRDWLDARIGLMDLGTIARKKEIPVHRHSIWYYLGGMTLFLFTVQVVTGILLLLYYRPSAEEAYESVQFLMAEVQFGWLVRSIHAWSANLMIFALFVHLLSVLLLRAYRPPREVTWLSGMALLVLALALGFTGYLLPWNTLALFATKVGTDIPGAVPVLGDFIRLVLRGGEEVTGATLTRFYGIHVAVLPALTTACLALHLYLVQRHGMSIPLDVDRGAPVRKMPFLPNFLLRDLIGWLVAVAVLVSLAAFFPTELGEKADPFGSAPASIRPEWYFMFMFQTLKLLPAHMLGVEGETIGVVLFALGGLVLALVPFLDRAAARGERNRLITFVSLALIAYTIAFTVWGYLSTGP